MSRRKGSKRGTKPQGGKSFGERSAKRKTLRKSPKHKVFRPIKGGVKDFGAGRSEEYVFRRQYPLLAKDVRELVDFTTRVVKRKGFRLHRQWVFVSVLVKALGGLYETKFSLIETKGDETEKFELKWISTHTVKEIRNLRKAIVDLLEHVIPFHLRERPAWILRVRITSFTPSNRTGHGRLIVGQPRMVVNE